MGWELNPGPEGKQPVLLTTKPYMYYNEINLKRGSIKTKAGTWG